MKSKQTFAIHWKLFAEDCGLQNAPAIQQREMRRAFYGGAGRLLVHLAAMPNDISEEDAASRLQAIEDEIMEFFNDVAEGRA